jgi:tRNA-dependent cyclodipeptide synthase
MTDSKSASLPFDMDWGGMDLDEATSQGLRRVSKRLSATRRLSSKLDDATRRSSMFGANIQTSISSCLLLEDDFDDEDDDNKPNDDNQQADKPNNNRVDIANKTAAATDAKVFDYNKERRASVLDVPDFEYMSTSFSTISFKPSGHSGSVDLGTKRYMAKVKAFSPKSLNIFKQKKVSLGVELGSQSTELARLDAVLQWITANFDECTIMVGDYVYRLTLRLKFGIDENEATDEALEAANSYKAMCTTILSQYTGLCKFEWRSMSSVITKYTDTFSDVYKNYKSLYLERNEFRELAKDFTKLYTSNMPKEDELEARLVSIRYLLEEFSVLDCLCKEGELTMVHAGPTTSVLHLCEGNFQPKMHLNYVQLAVSARGKFFTTGQNKVIKIGSLSVGTLNRPTASENFLAQLDAETRKQLDIITKPGKLRVGMLEGQFGKGVEASDKDMLIIEKGRVEELLHRDDGTLQRISLLADGSCINVERFMDGKPSSVLVNVLDETSVLVVKQKHFEKLLDKKPVAGIALLRTLGALVTARARSLLYDMQHMNLDIDITNNQARKRGDGAFRASAPEVMSRTASMT